MFNLNSSSSDFSEVSNDESIDFKNYLKMKYYRAISKKLFNDTLHDKKHEKSFNIQILQPVNNDSINPAVIPQVEDEVFVNQNQGNKKNICYNRNDFISGQMGVSSQPSCSKYIDQSFIRPHNSTAIKSINNSKFKISVSPIHHNTGNTSTDSSEEIINETEIENLVELPNNTISSRSYISNQQHVNPNKEYVSRIASDKLSVKSNDSLNKAMENPNNNISLQHLPLGCALNSFNRLEKEAETINENRSVTSIHTQFTSPVNNISKNINRNLGQHIEERPKDNSFSNSSSIRQEANKNFNKRSEKINNTKRNAIGIANEVEQENCFTNKDENITKTIGVRAKHKTILSSSKNNSSGEKQNDINDKERNFILNDTQNLNQQSITPNVLILNNSENFSSSSDSDNPTFNKKKRTKQQKSEVLNDNVRRSSRPRKQIMDPLLWIAAQKWVKHFERREKEKKLKKLKQAKVSRNKIKEIKENLNEKPTNMPTVLANDRKKKKIDSEFEIEPAKLIQLETNLTKFHSIVTDVPTVISKDISSNAEGNCSTSKITHQRYNTNKTKNHQSECEPNTVLLEMPDGFTTQALDAVVKLKKIPISSQPTFPSECNTQSSYTKKANLSLRDKNEKKSDEIQSDYSKNTISTDLIQVLTLSNNNQSVTENCISDPLDAPDDRIKNNGTDRKLASTGKIDSEFKTDKRKLEQSKINSTNVQSIGTDVSKVISQDITSETITKTKKQNLQSESLKTMLPEMSDKLATRAFKVMVKLKKIPIITQSTSSNECNIQKNDRTNNLVQVVTLSNNNKSTTEDSIRSDRLFTSNDRIENNGTTGKVASTGLIDSISQTGKPNFVQSKINSTNVQSIDASNVISQDTSEMKPNCITSKNNYKRHKIKTQNLQSESSKRNLSKIPEKFTLNPCRREGSHRLKSQLLLQDPNENKLNPIQPVRNKNVNNFESSAESVKSTNSLPLTSEKTLIETIGQTKFNCNKGNENSNQRSVLQPATKSNTSRRNITNSSDFESATSTIKINKNVISKNVVYSEPGNESWGAIIDNETSIVVKMIDVNQKLLGLITMQGNSYMELGANKKYTLILKVISNLIKITLNGTNYDLAAGNEILIERGNTCALNNITKSCSLLVLRKMFDS